MKRLCPFLLGFFLVFASCTGFESKDYLETVVAKLSDIETATYQRISESWQHGDTAASAIYSSFIKESRNPSDTTIGSNYISFESSDTALLNFAYDGVVRTMVYHDEKAVVIDNFTARPLPFRPVSPPFFAYVESILRYALVTQDSILLEINEHEQHVHVKLTILEDNQIEFFGKPHRMPLSPYIFDNTSIYEIWINKSTSLPYKYRREMSHSISVANVTDAVVNKFSWGNLDVSQYYPKGYTIESYQMGPPVAANHSLLDKQAPAWILQSSSTDSISLSDLKGRVVLLQFTSVSCGPCNMSIPFLNKLSSEFDPDVLAIAAIECSSKNTNVIANHKSKHGIQYHFLQSSKSVLNDYSVTSFPIFFILDNKFTVKKVFRGYAKDVTDKEITEYIKNMI